MPYIIVMISEEATGQEIVIDIMEETHKFQIGLRIFCISRNNKGTKNAIWRKIQIVKLTGNNLISLKVNGLEIGSLRCIVLYIAAFMTKKK